MLTNFYAILMHSFLFESDYHGKTYFFVHSTLILAYHRRTKLMKIFRLLAYGERWRISQLWRMVLFKKM